MPEVCELQRHGRTRHEQEFMAEHSIRSHHLMRHEITVRNFGSSNVIVRHVQIGEMNVPVMLWPEETHLHNSLPTRS